MKKFILILFIIFITKPSYAQYVVYYDPDKKLQVTDISGIKPEIEVYKEFDLGTNTTKKVYDNTRYDPVRQPDNTFTLFDKIQFREQLQQNVKNKKASITTKLKNNQTLSDDEIKFLLEK